MMTPEATTPSVEEQAADWASRLDGGPLTRAEAVALQTWLDADAAREPLLTEFQQLHGRVRAVLPGMARADLCPATAVAPSAVLRPPVAVFRRPSLWAGGLAAAAAVMLLTVWVVQRPQEISTHAAQRQAIVLADGTHIDLSAQTSLAVRLRGGERRVRMDGGEAYFAVAKDPARPFIIDTPAGTVRVTGTKFNVRADGADALEVTVLEGSVAVRPGAAGAERALKPNEQLGYDGAAAATRQLTGAAAEDVLAWREGRVVFDGTPIRVALERFARYHGCEIDVAASVETLRLGGRFRLDDLDGFLRDVEQTLPVRVLRPGAGRVRVVPR